MDFATRFERYKSAPLTWKPGQSGKPALVSWNDCLDKDLGEDPGGSRFDAIATRMMTGRYYPPQVINFSGDWEGRELRPGDRILQEMKLGPVKLYGMAEIFVAERETNRCKIGYVTTARHYGRGIWSAELFRENGRIRLQVRALSGPGSWLFWIGLPVARYLQMRAWRRAAEDFLSNT